ncbi:hypothetical protein CYK62_11125 [Clostridium perfringens]|uniref:hypothetical protein n=1 Tax=Clostridium perfringens TaxID=1502 RepID=UPI000D718D3B|nr:hypothetical protein [Clostridium perfringens]MBO3320264.1 hypothetical protein [Clostridium perfringens]PWX20493.1 hypothetical protein CYK62_11125 [Clostridium perfringens]
MEKRIPMTKEFNKKSVNDWLYGYLQSISYVDENKKTFVYKEHVNQSELVEKAPKNDKGKSPSKSKISRDFNKLIALGFIKETKVIGLNGNMVPAYELPYDKQELYKLIPLDTLIYLLDIGSKYLIKIYIYLLNKFQWKIKSGEYYNFSYKELIRECLGMKSTTNSRDYTIVRNCLDALIKLKMLELGTDYNRINGQLTTHFKLLSVKKTIKYDSILAK